MGEKWDYIGENNQVTLATSLETKSSDPLTSAVYLEGRILHPHREGVGSNRKCTKTLTGALEREQNLEMPMTEGHSVQWTHSNKRMRPHTGRSQ